MDGLKIGDSLGAGQQLTSPNGKYVLTMQSDGDLVLGEGGATVWSSGTGGSGAVRVDMQSDGNLVLYKESGEAAWDSKTDNHPGATLTLQDDRNLVVYAPNGDALWSSETYVTVDAAATEASVAPAAAEAAPAAPAPRTYTVKKGDTLWAIAKQFYGDGKQYPKIAQASGIANPDLIHPGQQLIIP